MKNSITFVSVFMFVLTTLTAQFSEYFAPANWTETETGCVTNGYLNASGAPASILLTGPDNYPEYACGSSVISLSIVAQVCGTIAFDWDYYTTDCNGPYWDRFGFLINGTPYQLSVNGSSSGSPGGQTGSASFTVESGDVIGFYIDAIDTWCGEAWVTLSNFSAPDAVCYGDDGEIKVELCHRGKTICVAPSAVAAHLAHGDAYGSCEELAECNEPPSYQVPAETAEMARAGRQDPAVNLRSSIDAAHHALANEARSEANQAVESYPNPVTDVVTFNFLRFDGPVTLEVYNTTGQRMLEATVNAVRGTPIAIDASGLPNGNYQVRLTPEKGMAVTRQMTILKEN